MAPTLGTRLGTYEIIAPLRAGGMGEVYCAKDLRLGRQVTLNVLHAHSTGVLGDSIGEPGSPTEDHGMPACETERDCPALLQWDVGRRERHGRGH